MNETKEIPELVVGATYQSKTSDLVYTLLSDHVDPNGRVAVTCGDGYTAVLPGRHLEKLPTFPEQWMNVYADGAASGSDTRAEADEWTLEGRIGVLHLRTDGTTEMLEP